MKNLLLYTILLTYSVVSFGQLSNGDSKSPTRDGNQKMNLDKPTSNRFVLPQNLVWPANVGDANVSLWKDDKLAAVTITIDDNIEGDHSWWLKMQEKYDIDFTWFLIINSVSDWDKYQKLIDAGNEVQTHDLAIEYGHGAVNDLPDDEYIRDITQARDTINEMLSDNHSLTFAYPYGKAKDFIIREKFIAMRGVYGVMNNANKINYLEVNSRSATNDPYDLEILLDPSKDLWNMKFYRGLASYHYHKVNYGQARTKTEAFLSAIHEKSDSIWAGMFSEVTRYGQERDTHTLTVDDIATEEIKFTLTDEMNDTYFDFPLTVKIRVENAWEGVKAVQGGKEIDAKIVEKEGNKYALVNAVPDKGQVIISKSGSLSNVDIEKKRINVYPNPVRSSEINIQLLDNNSENQNIELISVSGKIVYSSVIKKGDNKHVINLAKGVKHGVYILRISSKIGVVTNKIIVE
ncbi:MAG: T9SS type A sorting domain-containing protein [Flavobacteriales bacterium]|nr:T9SS type A sorting domain-containing protein [Flavobacteriales bacterium]